MNTYMRYVAINCDEPSVVAEFYKKWFGMYELGRSDDGDISLSDGWVNLSLLVMRPGSDQRKGFSHYGLAVDSLDELKERLTEVAPDTEILADKGGLHHGEYQMSDLNGVRISLSLNNFGVGEPPAEAAEALRIRHISLSTVTGPELLNYVTKVFGCRECSASIRRREAGTDEWPFILVGDGEVNLTYLPKAYMLVTPKRMDRLDLTEQHKVDGWFGHLGFSVPDLEKFVNAEDVKGNPAGRDMAEYRVFDPEGNASDLTETKGFEVDYDVWITGGKSLAAASV